MRRRYLSYGLLALAATATAGGLAAHRLLDRPGESAFAFVPADAKGVFAIDLVPAPDQVIAFGHINETLTAANKGKPTDPGSFIASMIDDPQMKGLVKEIDRSAAFAMMEPKPGEKKGDDDIDGVGFVALKDPAAFERQLQSTAKASRFGGTNFYVLDPKHPKESAVLMVYDRYAIVSDKPWMLDRVGRVIRGEEKPITSDPAFEAARQQAVPSANLLVLVSPKMAEGDSWTIASMAIRETGMDFGASGQSNDKDVLKMGQIAPLGKGLMDSLPKGAYGFMAMSQPGRFAELANEKTDESEDLKDLGLDLKKDVIPAMGGNSVTAFYPSFGPDAGLDVLLEADDANGADPANLAHKLENAIEEKSEGKPWRAPLTVTGGSASQLTGETQEEMQKGLREGERSFFRPLTLSRNKTVAWATVGHTVIVATSADLLQRAITSREAGAAADSLSSDPAFGANPAAAADGQFAIAFSAQRLTQGIRNTIDPSHMSADTAKIYRRVLSVFDGTKEPLALRAGVDPTGHYHAFASLPFDWSTLPGLVK